MSPRAVIPTFVRLTTVLGLTTGGAIAEVCQNGPPSLSVEAGAQPVVQILKEDL